MNAPHGIEADWPRLQVLYATYGRVLDSGEYPKWPEFFVDDAIYKVQSRENFDRGLPLAAIALESKAMLQDRVIGATDTIFHDPYYQRHVIGVPPVAMSIFAAVRVRPEASFTWFGPSSVARSGNSVASAFWRFAA